VTAPNLREQIEARLIPKEDRMTTTSTAALSRVDPQALITKAIETGAGIETLERLVTLATNVRQVTAREAWFEAMAEFQRRCPAIKKDSTAKIQTRTGGSYSYSYAALDTILAIVQPLLGELGLSLSWRQKHEASAVAASCVVAHKLGHTEESGFITMPYGADDGRMNPAQRVGSALTYARRYSLLAILGLAPEDDDDAQITETPARRIPGRRREEIGDADRPQSDPEAPELHAEAEKLFPSPEAEERTALIARIQKAGAKLTKLQRGRIKETFLGDAEADITTADVAALGALATHLEASA